MNTQGNNPIQKEIEKTLKKMPKFEVKASDSRNKDDVKKAKLMQKLVNYQFKHNVNGFQDKYFMLQKKLAELYAKEMLYGIKVRWDVVEKAVKEVTNLCLTLYKER